MLLIKTDGTRQEVPYTGNLKDWYKLIDCTTVECVSLAPCIDMWIDEEGRLKLHEINEEASQLYRYVNKCKTGYIAGNALICGIDETTGGSRELTDDERPELDRLMRYAQGYYETGCLGAPFEDDPPEPPLPRVYALDGASLDELLKELFA